MKPTSKQRAKRPAVGSQPATGPEPSPAWDRDEPYKELLRAVFAPASPRSRKRSANPSPRNARTRDA